jgi:hypothetical protein
MAGEPYRRGVGHPGHCTNGPNVRFACRGRQLAVLRGRGLERSESRQPATAIAYVAMSGISRNGSGGGAGLTLSMAAPSIRREGEPMKTVRSSEAAA